MVRIIPTFREAYTENPIIIYKICEEKGLFAFSVQFQDEIRFPVLKTLRFLVQLRILARIRAQIRVRMRPGLRIRL